MAAKKNKADEKPAKKETKNQKSEKTSANAKRDFITTEELCQLTGLTSGRISQLKKDGVIEPLPSGSKKEGDTWPVIKTAFALVRYYREKSDSRRSSDSETLAEEKKKSIAAKRKLDELKLAKLEGQLHEADDIERLMGNVLTRLRVNLLAIPTGIAPLLRGIDDVRKIAEKLDGRIRRALDEVSEFNLEKLVEKESLSKEDN